VINRSSIVVLLLVVVLTSQIQITASQAQDDFTTDARAFIELLVTKKFATAVAQFDTTMKDALPEAKLAETWASVLAQVGPFKQAGSARTERRGEFTVVVVTCDFQNAVLDVSVVFDQQKRVAGLFFAPAKKGEYTPPAYAKPDAFREKEVTVGTGEWALPGTLTVPVGAGPFPVVVLVHGSGPNDRDETIGPNKPFKDLAAGLASRGVAVLRYEKRTKQHGAKLVSVPNLTAKEEVIDDALAAVELLRKTEGIEAKRIFVLGHSLGGMFLPRIGRIDPNIAGLIALAGATRPLEDVIPEQLTYLFSLDGNVSPEEQKQIDQAKEQAAKVKALKAEDATSTTVIFGVPASYWLDLRGYDPAESAKTLKQPMLILQGERDYQVTMEDFKRWSAALAGRSNVTLKSYPGLNHLFIAGTTRSTPLEYDQPGHVDERVIDDIAGWIKKH
jgi:dienelactone hydrolase